MIFGQNVSAFFHLPIEKKSPREFVRAIAGKLCPGERWRIFAMKQPFCTPAQALRRVLDAAAALPVPATERVPLDDACGRIAARDLCARMDQPPFDRSPLDGYALHSADTAGAGEKTPVTLPVVMKLLPLL